MSALTEEGFMVFDTVDEFGRVVIDGLLEDGRCIVVVIVPPEYNIHLPKQYIKMYALVKRNGIVVHYCTPYTPFRTERAIQT